MRVEPREEEIGQIEAKMPPLPEVFPVAGNAGNEASRRKTLGLGAPGSSGEPAIYAELSVELGNLIRWN